MSSPFSLRKLLTIVCEASLESSLIADLRQRGVRGYTITEARGHGAHGTRDGLWQAGSNIRIEVLCDEQTATDLAVHLRDHYYGSYGMVVFVADVQVLRPEKFQAGRPPG